MHHTFTGPGGQDVSVQMSRGPIPGLLNMLHTQMGGMAGNRMGQGNEALVFPMNGRPFSPFDIFSPG